MSTLPSRAASFTRLAALVMGALLAADGPAATAAVASLKKDIVEKP